MDHETITGFKIKRSGATMTIVGTGADGKSKTVTGVEDVTGTGGRTVATTTDGVKYLLVS